MDKKNVFFWTLYDFANSITTIVFFLYFSQWLVIDKGVPDFWYNMIFTIGSVMLLLTAPILGGIADRNGKQQNYLSWITILTFFSFLGVSFITLFFSHKVFLAVLFFLIANYLYQFSFVFYNALLHYIAPPEKWGRISGIGQTGNWLGQIAGLVITLPLASSAIYLVGEAGRAQTFLPATIIFFIISLPMLIYFKLPKQEKTDNKIILKEEYKNYWNQFKELLKSPSMGLFLLAFFFFNDAILTAANNFPIYLEVEITKANLIS
ncbi:MAG: MFS transporter family protein [Parcubacteria group bacterium GW2011_GWF2_44_8b]|nr:MAG: MFS transporter family protein [Parcubacteria group bacterium GW2011_GWC1_43_30]KKT80631.1 MAG: MFS transporter family protein [Parcubacteria group bacterium GW2011_GWF2_44_8b]